MELKNGPLSIPQLFMGGLKIANQAFGAALALFILLFLLGILVSATGAFATWLFPQYGLFFQIIFSLLNAWLGLVAPLALIQLIAAKIEKTGLSAWESITGSVMPAVYFLASSLILMIPAMIILFGAFLSRSNAVIIIVYIVLALMMFPFVFTQHTIALRGEGPISGLRYSWQLASAHYAHILLSILSIVVAFVLVILAAVCAVKAFLPHDLFANPLLLQTQLLQTPKLYLILIAIIGMMLYVFILLTIQTIMTLLFLNLDYCHRSVQSREMDMSVTNDAISIDVANVQVMQASVLANADADTIRNLDQVYSAQEHLAQAIAHQEDRMPTLVFDEEMAEKLAEQERLEQERKKDKENPNDDDPPSIKISK